jgi:hypothetical protein
VHEGGWQKKTRCDVGRVFAGAKKKSVDSAEREVPVFRVSVVFFNRIGRVFQKICQSIKDVIKFSTLTYYCNVGGRIRQKKDFCTMDNRFLPINS